MKGRKGDGEMERVKGRWRDGEMERWRDGEMERGREGARKRTYNKGFFSFHFYFVIFHCISNLLT
jgi:hypothetical protein